MPSPNSKGWKFEASSGQEELKVDWMDGSPAPETVLELLACNCPRICRLPQCSCMVNNMKCSELFKLKDCTNQPEDDEPQILEDDDINELDFE